MTLPGSASAHAVNNTKQTMNFILKQNRGGYRILLYKFARFSQKLHEIKKMLVRRGGRAGGAPLGSATAKPSTSTTNK